MGLWLFASPFAVPTFADRGRVAPPRGAPWHTADGRLSQELVAPLAGEVQHLSRLIDELLGAQGAVGWGAWILAGLKRISCATGKSTLYLQQMIFPQKTACTDTYRCIHAYLRAESTTLDWLMSCTTNSASMVEKNVNLEKSFYCV